ncbi:outer membrane beta-barrel protein [Flavitalea antarctica]
MIKHLLITVIMITTLSASAQVNKGSILLGGNLGFATENNEDYKSKTTSTGVSISVGKAIRQNLVAGSDISHGYYRTKTNDTSKTIQQYYGAGFFLRKYAALGKGFYLFGQARAGASYTTIKQELSYLRESKGYVIGIYAYPGFSYELNRKLHLEASLPGFLSVYYQKSKNEDPDGSKSVNSVFAFSSAISNAAALSIGLRILIAR